MVMGKYEFRMYINEEIPLTWFERTSLVLFCLCKDKDMFISWLHYGCARCDRSLTFSSFCILRESLSFSLILKVWAFRYREIKWPAVTQQCKVRTGIFITCLA